MFRLHSPFDFQKLEPKACGRPEQPPNSTMVALKGFDVGATVEYGCDDGHLLVGPSTRACLDTGFYNEFPPVCKCKLSFRVTRTNSFETKNETSDFFVQTLNAGYRPPFRMVLTN